MLYSATLPGQALIYNRRSGRELGEGTAEAELVTVEWHPNLAEREVKVVRIGKYSAENVGSGS